MTFKTHWEKTDHHFQISTEMIQDLVNHALPNAALLSHEVISGGCANLNIKLNLLNEPQPLILRVYVRDKDAAYREKKLAALIKHSVPLPEVYCVGDFAGHRFAITEYMSGMNLRDLLLNPPNGNIQSIMVQVGQILASIQKYEFPTSGFFDTDLKVSEPLVGQSYMTYARECLAHPTVIDVLGAESIHKINETLEKYNSFFPDETQTHLVHGDYGPENILVDKVEGQWKITAILDWEFAYSGSTLSDMSNMLRYAHHMPDVFEEAFLEGLTQGGVTLPENWRISVYLLDLIALLGCLLRASPKTHPKQCTDIREVMGNILLNLERMEG
jgi:aminoglycoside phosphotransferase (APT) family kinase protein